jgi:LacI family transcriptional regulator
LQPFLCVYVELVWWFWGWNLRVNKKADRVYYYLLRGLETGRYRIGDRIPTERDLAAQFALSRPTVSGAIKRLAHAKLIGPTQRKGSVVLKLPPARPLIFGFVVLDQNRRPDESIFSVLAKEMLRRAAAEHSFIALHDPSRGEDPGDPGLFVRYRTVATEFIKQKVDGVFLMPQLILPDQYVSATTGIAEEIEKASIPVVLIDGDVVRYPDRSHFDWVGIDNFHSGFIMAKHFIRLGCRRIDFFAITTRHSTQEARIAGYLKALEDQGIRPDADGIHHGDLLNGDFATEVLRHRRPEAVIVVNDFQGASVMRQATQAGIKIPGQLRVGSFDDLPMARTLPVPLTTIRQPVAGMAEAAYRTMLQRISAPGLPPLHIELKGELIIRASSGTVRR